MTHIQKRLLPGNVVKAFQIGNTRVKICDDFCRDKSPAEVQEILERIAHRAQVRLSAQNKEV